MFSHPCARWKLVIIQVKIKTHVKSGGLRPSAFGGGSGNDPRGVVANGNKDLGGKGGWRTSNEGQGGRSARSRATRDSKQAAGAMVMAPRKLLESTMYRAWLVLCVPLR